MGSVKDIRIISYPEAEKSGLGFMNFSDRYSVFDWGQMPDTIPNKGAATAILGGYFFEKLEKYGINTHYHGLIEDSIPRRLSELKGVSKYMYCDIFRVINPLKDKNHYVYDTFQYLTSNFLIPLEIIYRNFLPEGSSIFKRFENEEIRPEDFGLKSIPEPNSELKTTIIDFSTKLEVTDRYISKIEAQEIADLDNSEINSLFDICQDINELISAEYKKIGIKNLDGKIETAFNRKRKITVVDVLGTLDECRFELNGVHLSKEAARIHYRKSDWYHETERAKTVDRLNWKNECKLQPEPLPAEFRTLLSFMYCEVTNQITGRNWFKIPLSLPEIVDGIKTYMN